MMRRNTGTDCTPGVWLTPTSEGCSELAQLAVADSSCDCDVLLVLTVTLASAWDTVAAMTETPSRCSKHGATTDRSTPGAASSGGSIPEAAAASSRSAHEDSTALPADLDPLVPMVMMLSLRNASLGIASWHSKAVMDRDAVVTAASIANIRGEM